MSKVTKAPKQLTPLLTKQELLGKFGPLVMSDLIDYGFDDADISVTFIEDWGSGQMWHLRISLGRVDLSQIAKVAEVASSYWTAEAKQYSKRMSDGRLAQLGDGDDSGAAWFEDGRFVIWLRVWAIGEEYGFGLDA